MAIWHVFYLRPFWIEVAIWIALLHWCLHSKTWQNPNLRFCLLESWVSWGNFQGYMSQLLFCKLWGNICILKLLILHSWYPHALSFLCGIRTLLKTHVMVHVSCNYLANKPNWIRVSFSRWSTPRGQSNNRSWRTRYSRGTCVPLCSFLTIASTRTLQS